MSTLSLPLDFGRRQCDRLLVRTLSKDNEREAILWRGVLVWQDYATAREDRRQVPADPAVRATCDAVAILEEFIGWKGPPGAFIESAISSGFFMLTPVTEEISELVLTDFFPANASAAKVSNSESGGIGRSFGIVARRAEMAASDQLKLFEREGGVPGLDEHRTRAALKLIHSICLALQRKFPVDETWKTTLVHKAAGIIQNIPQRDRDCVIRWYIKNRDSQRIALRLDLILDQFRDFVPEAVTSFGR